MGATVTVPVEWVKFVSGLQLPPQANERLQHLMHENTEGRLTEIEREELEVLIELSEQLSLVRAQALQLLGHRPQGGLACSVVHTGFKTKEFIDEAHYLVDMEAGGRFHLSHRVFYRVAVCHHDGHHGLGREHSTTVAGTRKSSGYRAARDRSAVCDG